MSLCYQRLLFLTGLLFCTAATALAVVVNFDGFDSNQSFILQAPGISGSSPIQPVTGAVSDLRGFFIQANVQLRGNKSNSMIVSGSTLTLSQGTSNPGATYRVNWIGSTWNTSPYNLASAIASFDFTSYTFEVNVAALSNATPQLQISLISAAGTATYVGTATTGNSIVTLSHVSGTTTDPSQITSIAFITSLAKSTGGSRSITIGDIAAVPEPSATAVVLAIVAGLATIVSRRRRLLKVK